MAEAIGEDNSRILGRDAQRNNILAARVIAETVKTTLGPKGMDKMLVDRAGNITITNDGVTILEEMEIDHPAAKMIVEIAKTQETEVGDGTTTAVMLAGKLLENAEKLLDSKIHPTTITRGYRWASEKAIGILKDLSVEIDSKEELVKVASTAMTGKGAEFIKEKLGELIVDAVETISDNGKINLENIKIIKQRGGSIEETSLIKGLIIEEESLSENMPKRVNDAKIAILEEPLEIKNLETETKLHISMPDQLQSFLSQEEAILKSKVEKLKEIGTKVLFLEKTPNNIIKYYLEKEGILAISKVSKEDLEKISLATSAKIISKLNESKNSDLGFASLVEEKTNGDEKFTYITGCKNPKALTLLIKGGTNHLIDEIERAIHDALGVVQTCLKDSKVVAGAGAIEIELSKKIREYAKTIKSRERLSIEEFASSIEVIPITLAENAGLDPIDILTELKSNHDAGNKNSGINLFNGKIEDTLMKGIIEPLKTKIQAINSATEVAIMILRIDDVIAAKKNQNKNLNTSSMYGYE